MITKAFLEGIIKKFQYCKDIDFIWNTRLFEKTDSESWSNILVERSRDLRNSYDIFEETIKNIKSIFNNELTDKEYRLVADAILKVYKEGYDDFYVYSFVLEPLIEYFKGIDDLDYLLPLIHVYCFENEQFNSGILTNSKYKYIDVFKYKDRYVQIKSRYARLTLIKSISNELSCMLNSVDNKFENMYNLYKDILNLWNKEEVQNLDGNDEEFLYFIDRIKDILLLYDNVETLSVENYNVYENLMKEKISSCERESEVTVFNGLYNAFLYHKGEISSDEYINRLLVSFDEIFALLDIYGDENEQEDYIDDCFNIIDSLVSTFPDIESKDEIKLVKEKINKFRIHVKSIPYTFYNNEMNRFFFELYKRCYSLMTFEEKKEYIIEVIMFRQPITCIHSIMVSKLVGAITKCALKNNKELFVGILDTKNVDDVNDKFDEILNYSIDNALFHDVGKIVSPHIINTQNRKLSDMEFELIRKHPKEGINVLESDPDFNGYYDVMLGHHKYYDGSMGYPSDFDNTKSKVKIIIDIVSIADSIDAATDILGRNYNKGKSFETLVSELKDGMNTRYNPDIVNLILNNKDLYEKLNNLTQAGRFETYKYVYSKYIK